SSHSRILPIAGRPARDQIRHRMDALFRSDPSRVSRNRSTFFTAECDELSAAHRRGRELGSLAEEAAVVSGSAWSLVVAPRGGARRGGEGRGARRAPGGGGAAVG